MADNGQNVDKKVIDLLKKNPDISTAELIKRTGIPASQIGRHIYYGEPVANPKLKFKGTPAAIQRARDVENLRWERIAARTGLSVSEVRSIYEERTGEDYSKSYIGRGRRFDGSAPASKSSKKSAGGKGTGRATSGRRAAANGRKKATKKAARPKARTRADLKAKAGSPS